MLLVLTKLLVNLLSFGHVFFFFLRRDYGKTKRITFQGKYLEVFHPSYAKTLTYLFIMKIRELLAKSGRRKYRVNKHKYRKEGTLGPSENFRLQCTEVIKCRSVPERGPSVSCHNKKLLISYGISIHAHKIVIYLYKNLYSSCKTNGS